MKNAITNLDRLNYILKAAKKDKTFNQYVSHLKKVLAPRKKGTICKEIIELHRQGYSNAEIVEAGYNKITVSRQVKEYRTKTTFAISCRKEAEKEK